MPTLRGEELDDVMVMQRITRSMEEAEEVLVGRDQNEVVDQSHDEAFYDRLGQDADYFEAIPPRDAWAPGVPVLGKAHRPGRRSPWTRCINLSAPQRTATTALEGPSTAVRRRICVIVMGGWPDSPSVVVVSVMLATPPR